MSKVIEKMIGFSSDFLLILGGFWEGLGDQVGPKIHQKSIKNRYGKVIEFLMEKWRHLGGIWRHLGKFWTLSKQKN